MDALADLVAWFFIERWAKIRRWRDPEGEAAVQAELDRLSREDGQSLSDGRAT